MANSIILRDEKKSQDLNKRRQIPLPLPHDLKAFSKSECDKKLMVSGICGRAQALSSDQHHSRAHRRPFGQYYLAKK
jgi:hypothetical protein